MNKSNSNKLFFNKIWNKFKNHLMINFKTDQQNQKQETYKFVDEAFDNQDNLFIMISNGLKLNNTKGNKVKLDENKIAEIIVTTVQPMLDRALEQIKKDISELKSDVSELKQDVKILKREVIKHGWDLTSNKE